MRAPMSPANEAAPVLARLQAAVDHLNSGRLEDALQAADHVLRLRPDDGSALNVIGVVALQRGDYARSAELFRKALRVQPANPFIHFNLAEAHRRSHALGNALTHYERAIRLHPDFAEAHAHKGEALRAKGKLIDAAASYRKALDCQPGLASALNGLGRLLQTNGEQEQAARHYEAAIAAQPVGDPSAIAALFANAGLLRLQRGAALEGFEALAEAIHRAPEMPEFWRLLGQHLRDTKVIPKTEAFRNLVLSLLARPDVDPTALATAAVALLKRDAEMAERLTHAREAAESGGKQVAHQDLLPLLRDPLLQALMVRAPLPDVEIELVLTDLRRSLLLAAAGGDFGVHDELGLEFVASLAQQCFLNEYIYFQGMDEEQALSDLREQLPTLDFESKDAWLIVATLACYLPIGELGLVQSVPASLPAHAEPVLLQQLQEPAEEARLAETLMASANEPLRRPEMSAALGDQPFPRWTQAFRGSPKPLHEAVRAVLNHLSAHEVPSVRTPRVLIAGCRTGLPVLSALGAYEGASIVAVDSNLRNLAYARRKMGELGVEGIEFMLAEVQGVASLGAQFDLIEAPFAFYDHNEPEVAISSLARALKPGGLLRFKLYSQTAREAVSRVHAIIALSGTGMSLDGLRSLRRDLMLNPITSEMDVIKSPASDFWASSPCRELLLRPDERRFDLAEVGTLLRPAGLDFLGLELGHRLDWARFEVEHPEPDAQLDLEAWRQFEADHPEVFGAGYGIWTRKRHARR